MQGLSETQTLKQITGLTVTPLDHSRTIELPPTYVNNNIPPALGEIPTPETVASIPEFAHLAQKFPNKKDWSTIALIGRDCTPAQEQKQLLRQTGQSPIITQTPLGWALIGPIPDPTPAKFTPPPINILTETTPQQKESDSIIAGKNDELLDYSQEERRFLLQVVPQVRQRKDGRIQLPLPFKQPNPSFTNNRAAALRRTKSTLMSMKQKYPEVLKSSLDKFAKNLIGPNPQFAPVPSRHRYITTGKAYWIPLFSVWQKGKARIVFDAKAQTNGICLNDHLLQGPDRNNSLRGVLMRFCREPYALIADIENMFHQFTVPEEQATYMRFFWFRDNDPNKEIIEYWSNVHLMGETSSPAIANLGVRYAARKEPPTDGHQWLKEDDILNPDQTQRTRIPDRVETLLTEQFYVDDFLASLPTPEEALEVIDEGVARLKRYHLNLCKVRSNCPIIQKAYPMEEKPTTTLSLSPRDPLSNTPMDSTSLGLQWHIDSDRMSIKTEHKLRPMTKRGLLGYVNSPYDPFGMAAPAMLQCKLLQREIFPQKEQDPHHFNAMGWDDPIPERFTKQWEQMIKTCNDVQDISMPRAYYPKQHGAPVQQQLFGFADASDLALSCVVYLRTLTSDGRIYVAFVCGSSKVLPKGTSLKGQLSIPRAELCAADELAKRILDIENEIKIPQLQPTQLFTDSRDVHQWITNTTDNFKRYVTSRRDRICRLTSPSQWHYIQSEYNPADIGTRPITVEKLKESTWIKGPTFLRQQNPQPPERKGKQPTMIEPPRVSLASFFKFSARHATEDITNGNRWKSLLEQFKKDHHLQNDQEASKALQLYMQHETWPKGLQTIHNLPPNQRTNILALSPFLDQTDKLVKVGGRLAQSDLTFNRKHPTLIPDSELGDALIGFVHSSTEHQGRKISSATLRTQGFFSSGWKTAN